MPALFDGKKGFLNPKRVRAIAFHVTVSCIALSIVTSILAIWDFAEKNVLGRLLATYCVIALGVLLFALVNQWFGSSDSSSPRQP